MTSKRTRRRPATAARPAEPRSSAATIDLGASCTLHEVAALRAVCLAALEAAEPPVIDGSRVEHVDTAGLQALVGFTIDCMERSRHFTWQGRSEVLVQGIRLLGVEALLESPGVAASATGDAA